MPPKRPAIIVVDPLLCYLVGDEDNSANVSGFFDVLMAYAARSWCTVLLVHHLTKKAKPTSLKHVHNMIRGSAVLRHRSRMVLGLISPCTGVRVSGITKNNFLENDVSWAEIQIKLEKGCPVAISENQRPRNKKPARQQGHSSLLEAIIDLIADGNRVTRPA